MIFQKIAQFISVITHPLLMINYGIFSILYFDIYHQSRFYDEQLSALSIYILVSTLLIPILFIYLLKKLKFINSFNLENAKQRLLPYSSVAILLSLTCWQLYNNELDSLIFNFLLASIISIVLNIFINFKFKISSHAIAASGYLALMINRIQNQHFEFIFLFIMSLIILGLVIWSRIILKAHRINEIIYGSILGFLVVYLSCFYEF